MDYALMMVLGIFIMVFRMDVYDGDGYALRVGMYDGIVMGRCV